LEAARYIIAWDKVELDFLICCTGAFIIDGDYNLIYEDTAEFGDYMKALVEEAGKLGSVSLCATYRMLRNYIDASGKIPFDNVAMTKFNHANTWFGDEESAAKFCKIVNEKYGDKITAYQNGKNVDMPPVGNSKTTGIYKYASKFENPKIYAVGDNFNDIPMLKEFESFAVSNAQDEVKKVASHTCDRICDMIDFILNEDK
jgi:hypothetical protein